jgi:hypothetical protein
MRKEIFETIRKAMLESGDVKHVDLWNQNVEFLEQEDNWPRPAVFIEFDPIVWDRTKEPRSMYAISTFKLHIVTDWVDTLGSSDSTLNVFELSRQIQGIVELLSGMKFGRCVLIESHTNHNHEEIMETIDVYKYRGQEFIMY